MSGGKPFPEKPQLCWKCSHCTGGCSWSDHLVPVDGWTAMQTFDKWGRPYSWLIEDCPGFVAATRGKIELSNDEEVNEGVMALLEQAMKIARNDYLQTQSMNVRDEIVCFLADWLPDWQDTLKQLHADRNLHWGMKLLDVIMERINNQPVLLMAGGEEVPDGGDS